MPIERKTVIDQIEVRRDGVIQLRFGLLLVEGDVELDCKWHRTAIEPGADMDAQLGAVNRHLQQMGQPEIETARLPLLKSIRDTVQTPDVIARHNEKRNAILPGGGRQT